MQFTFKRILQKKLRLPNLEKIMKFSFNQCIQYHLNQSNTSWKEYFCQKFEKYKHIKKYQTYFLSILLNFYLLICSLSENISHHLLVSFYRFLARLLVRFTFLILQLSKLINLEQIQKIIRICPKVSLIMLQFGDINQISSLINILFKGLFLINGLQIKNKQKSMKNQLKLNIKTQNHFDMNKAKLLRLNYDQTPKKSDICHNLKNSNPSSPFYKQKKETQNFNEHEQLQTIQQNFKTKNTNRFQHFINIHKKQAKYQHNSNYLQSDLQKINKTKKLQNLLSQFHLKSIHQRKVKTQPISLNSQYQLTQQFKNPKKYIRKVSHTLNAIDFSSNYNNNSLQQSPKSIKTQQKVKNMNYSFKNTSFIQCQFPFSSKSKNHENQSFSTLQKKNNHSTNSFQYNNKQPSIKSLKTQLKSTHSLLKNLFPQSPHYHSQQQNEQLSFSHQTKLQNSMSFDCQLKKISQKNNGQQKQKDVIENYFKSIKSLKNRNTKQVIEKTLNQNISNQQINNSQQISVKNNQYEQKIEIDKIKNYSINPQFAKQIKDNFKNQKRKQKSNSKKQINLEIKRQALNNIRKQYKLNYTTESHHLEVKKLTIKEKSKIGNLLLKNNKNLQEKKQSKVFYQKQSFKPIIAKKIPKVEILSSIPEYKIKRLSQPELTPNIQSSQQNQQLYLTKYQFSSYINQKIKSNIKTIDFIFGPKLGYGKFGIVHLVRHHKTGFLFALKTIKKQLIKQQKIMDRVIQEIKIQYYLNHAQLVKLYGFFYDQQNIYLILQYCPDGQLYHVFQKNGKFEEKDVSKMMKQLCEGILEMHKNSIIHRDLKPENVVISFDLYKICDFGQSTRNKNQFRNTLCGTPLYFSPELLGGKFYNEKVDIWALGMIAFQMLVGSIPFVINCSDQLLKIINQQIHYPDTISPIAKDFISNFLQRDPSLRISVFKALGHKFIL